MQLQADTLQVPLSGSEVTETTALGAAFAAGLAVGVWDDLASVAAVCRRGSRWQPDAGSALPTTGWREWNRAVDRSLDWATPDNHVKETA